MPYVATRRRRNYSLAGAWEGDLPEIDIPTEGDIPSEGEMAALPAAPAEAGGLNLFGIHVPYLYLLGGAAIGYFMGDRSDAMRNALLGAGAGVGISYFMEQ